jgi:DNA-binding NarL/FixJ family response regulator
VGSAPDGAAAITMARELLPDVVLMDLSMPGVDGVEATRAIVTDSPGIRVVVLTTFADRTHVTGAIDAGAVGFLLKDADPETLSAAIRSAHRGEAPLDPRAALALIDRRKEPASASGVALTPREREVLELVGAGLSNRMIARRLGISEKTVKAHLTSVFTTIGVTDRVQAALWWQAHQSDAD